MTDAPQGPGRRLPSEEEIAAYVPNVTRGREARLGAFVILALLSLVLVLYTLTSPAGFRGRSILYSNVEEGAGGVRKGDAIQMRGVNIGRLADFEMEADGTVTMKLEIDGWEIPIGSTTRLGAVGMFGGRIVEIVPTLNTLFHADGDTIPGVGGSAGGILGSMDELSDQGGRVLTQLESFFSDETIGSVQGSASELERLLTSLSEVVNEQREGMSTVVEALQASAEGIGVAAAAGPDLASAIARADSVMAALNETSATLDGALETVRSILDKIDGGEGTLGKLLNEDGVYVAYLDLAEQIASLVQDIRDNPKKYINLSLF